MLRLRVPMLLAFLGATASACGSDTKIDRVNAPPTASIEAPTEGQVFRQGEALIELVGSVDDSFDDPPELEVLWTVDDGSAQPATASGGGAVGGTVDGATLALGDHTATLTVTDTDGATGSADVTFTIAGPLGAPTVAITSPEDGSAFDHDVSITFIGEASDVTTPPEDLEFAWSDDVEGPLAGAISGDGQSALVTNTLSIGEHVVTLTVTDGDGEVGTAAVHITINDDTPIPPEPGQLIFTEFMVDPSTKSAADEDGEWVELYNTSGSTLDIRGYSFHDDDSDIWVFDTSIAVEPHGYMVLCANIDPTRNGGVACDGWFYRQPMGEEPSAGWGHGSGVALANNDDEIELTSPEGVDIDIFDYNDTDSDPIVSGQSFGLDPERLDGVLNDDINNWCVQTTVQSGMVDPATPGLPNDSCGLEPL